MRKQSYARFRPSYSAVVSTLALAVALAALCVGGALATGVVVTSKQIKNGTILTQDLHKNAVKSTDIAESSVQSSDIGSDQVQAADIGAGQVDSEAIGNGDVSSADIGNGQVKPDDVTMPPPAQLEAPGVATASAPDAFVPVDLAGTYAKQDGSSVLEVSWTGTAQTDFSACIFQLRVDGSPSADAGGQIYLASGTTLSVSASALFEGFSAGPHQIEVWAKSVLPGAYPCTVGPAFAELPQTFVISEHVF